MDCHPHLLLIHSSNHLLSRPGRLSTPDRYRRLSAWLGMRLNLLEAAADKDYVWESWLKKWYRLHMHYLTHQYRYQRRCRIGRHQDRSNTEKQIRLRSAL